MQFFYLIPFAVAASYAVALPQPAGLSEKYSNNADITFASFLEARSYQPVLNSQKDSPTLMSLERRADSAGSSGGSSGSGTPPPPISNPEDAQRTIYGVFTKSNVTSENLASTIKKVGDGVAKLSEDGEKVKTKIGGTVGDMVALYLRRSLYVILALRASAGSEGDTILSTIRSAVGDAKFPDIFTSFFQTFIDSMTGSDKKKKEAADFILNILKDNGTVVQNVEAAIQLLVGAINDLIKFFDTLKTLLENSESGKTLYDYTSTMMKILAEFIAEQGRLHAEIITALKVASPK
ncbi:hypothetical protein BASA50_001621 [Batrachochytrium salamandrivorans]|uniref:Uncharacterized protein n=1 Tax=Batrachochytrium salamandrivorans TaxID=1357716 RepID=A0ABQ8FRJ7_9FUNG|nr:hypothetical protein BASA60_008866 [Batrachochytrium salamandrivorans]KAH6601432.1 hypothetical protein BASA50_001621 [Batrachochytrium salamandrivorans]KAH9272906.1 hypothetical protein BASA83_004796 [Batrachochytrium salamandrivorans]